MTPRSVSGLRTQRVLVRGRPRRGSAIGSLLAGLVFIAFYGAVAWFVSEPRTVIGIPITRDSLSGNFMVLVAALFVVALIWRTPTTVREWRGPARLGVSRSGLGWPRGESDLSGQVLIPWPEIVGVTVHEPTPDGYHPGPEATAVLDRLAVALSDGPSVAHTYRVRTWLGHRVPAPLDGPAVPPRPDVLVVTVVLRPGSDGRRRIAGHALTEVDGLAREAAAHDRERVAVGLVEVRDRLDRWQRSWSAAPQPCTAHVVVDRADVDGLVRAVRRARPGATVTRRPLGAGDLDTPHLLARVAADAAARSALLARAPAVLGRRMRIAALTEDVALLLHDPASDKPRADRDGWPRVLAGALLLDLVACGRVDPGRPGHRRVTVVDRVPSGDALVDVAVERLRGSRSPKQAVEKLEYCLPDMVLNRLAGTGSGYPRPAEREALRVRLDHVLTREAPPSEHEIALLSLVAVVHDLRSISDARASVLRARVRRLRRDPWVANAVRKAVQAQAPS